jgi:hypothetical protein
VIHARKKKTISILNERLRPRLTTYTYYYNGSKECYTSSVVFLLWVDKESLGWGHLEGNVNTKEELLKWRSIYIQRANDESLTDRERMFAISQLTNIAAALKQFV